MHFTVKSVLQSVLRLIRPPHEIRRAEAVLQAPAKLSLPQGPLSFRTTVPNFGSGVTWLGTEPNPVQAIAPHGLSLPRLGPFTDMRTGSRMVLEEIVYIVQGIPLTPERNIEVMSETRPAALKAACDLLDNGMIMVTIIGDGRVYTVQELAHTIANETG
jgi:hypothetical protein